MSFFTIGILPSPLRTHISLPAQFDFLFFSSLSIDKNYFIMSLAVQSFDFIIVLGQSLIRDLNTGALVVPPTLTSRVDTAAKLWFDLKQQKDKKDAGRGGDVQILVSGADVVKIGKSEAQCMFEMLRERAVPASVITMDDKARNTCENAINTLSAIAAIVEKQQQLQRAQSANNTDVDADPMEQSIGIALISSDFHIPRANYIFCCIRNYLGGADEKGKQRSNNSSCGGEVSTTTSASSSTTMNNNSNTFFSRLLIHPIGSPNCLPGGQIGGDHIAGMRIKEVNDMPESDRLKHEAFLLQRGGKQDDHFRPYNIAPDEQLRAVGLAALAERIRKLDATVSSE